MENLESRLITAVKGVLETKKQEALKMSRDNKPVNVASDVYYEKLERDLEKAIEKAIKESFWQAFHVAWGKDRGDGERRSDYNKKAWMYVQAKIEDYFQKKTAS